MNDKELQELRDFEKRESDNKLRDWFAGMVIGHLVVCPARSEMSEDSDARFAYKVADAMIIARMQHSEKLKETL